MGVEEGEKRKYLNGIMSLFRDEVDDSCFIRGNHNPMSDEAIFYDCPEEVTPSYDIPNTESSTVGLEKPSGVFGQSRRCCSRNEYFLFLLNIKRALKAIEDVSKETYFMYIRNVRDREIDI